MEQYRQRQEKSSWAQVKLELQQQQGHLETILYKTSQFNLLATVSIKEKSQSVCLKVCACVYLCG